MFYQPNQGPVDGKFGSKSQQALKVFKPALALHRPINWLPYK